MHGPTFMGNPLACAGALKGIEIFEREDCVSKIHRITEISHREMDGFTDPRIREVRIMGGCTCVDVYDPRNPGRIPAVAPMSAAFSAVRS